MEFISVFRKQKNGTLEFFCFLKIENIIGIKTMICNCLPVILHRLIINPEIMNNVKKIFFGLLAIAILPPGMSVAQSDNAIASSLKRAVLPDRPGVINQNRKADSDSVASEPEFHSMASADEAMLARFMNQDSRKPATRKTVSPQKNVGTTSFFHYTGFNSEAGIMDDGVTTTGGYVSFNLYKDYSDPKNPADAFFSCDTISTGNLTSPYSVRRGNRLLALLPKSYDRNTYPSITCSVFDANDLSFISTNERATAHEGAKSYVPYFMAWDEATNTIYGVSMEDFTDADGHIAGTKYYFNEVDPVTCALRRIGLLGTWKLDTDGRNFVPNGLCCHNGEVYLAWYDDKISWKDNPMAKGMFISKVNTCDASLETVGSPEISCKGLYGLQPMVYDVNVGKILINHYDLFNGTSYYWIDVDSGADADGNLPTTKILDAPTGYVFFYQRPQSENTGYSYNIGEIADFKIETEPGNRTAKISFTTPAARYADGSPIPFGASDTRKLNYTLVSNNPDFDGNSMSIGTSQLDYGKYYESTVNLPEGLNNVTLSVSCADKGLSIQPVNASQYVFIGYDVASAVNNPELSIEGTKAIISWEAPASSRYSDFGSTYDSSAISYRVVRSDGLFDEVTSSTEITDDTVPEEIAVYSYMIYPISGGKEGVGSSTREQSGGLYLKLPYTNSFTDKISLEGFTILNVNDDGEFNTWQRNMYGNYVFTPSNRIGDDWLITPALKLKADELYRFRIKVKGEGSLRVTCGTSCDPIDQNIVLGEISETRDVTRSYDSSTRRDYEWREYYFVPSADGIYHIGLYDYSGYSESHQWSVDSMSFEMIASAFAPAEVEELEFKEAAGGELKGEISFKLPVYDINGNELTDIDHVAVYDADGKELARKNQVSGGEYVSLDVEAIQGWNRFYVRAANGYGDGKPGLIEKYIGYDVPRPITGLEVIWSEDEDVVEIHFDPVDTVGRNGGYVDPSDVEYVVYQFDNEYYYYYEIATSTEAGIIEVPVERVKRQEQFVFCVTANNREGESLYRSRSIVCGEPYEIPYSEPFSTEGLYHSPYILIPGINNQNWSVDADRYNYNVKSYDDDGVHFIFAPVNDGEASGSLSSPIIDLTEAECPQFSVWFYHLGGTSDKAYATIDASIDGCHYEQICDSVILSGDNGWQEHIFDLSKVRGHKVQLAVRAYSPTPADRIYMDNWNIYDAKGNNLAITGITGTENANIGDTVTVTVTVANKGNVIAEDYGVLFNVDDESVASVMPENALKPGEQITIGFPLAITAENTGKSIYNATLDYEDDDESDNTSADMEITGCQIDLKTPENVNKQGDTLSWEAPEAYDEYPVLLDFEKEKTFEKDNISGWTTFDGDGHLTKTFTQTDDIYWPYANMPLAWMVWSLEDIGDEVPITWIPFKACNGRKALISWGDLGITPDGRKSETPDDDWFISPEVKGDTEFSFQALTYNLTSKIEVLTSSTGRQPSDFDTLVETISFYETDKYNLYTLTLPEEARYVALRVVKNGYCLMVDDISYVSASVPVLSGYNVYCNGKRVATTSETQYTIDKAGSYSVSAQYNFGESRSVLAKNAGLGTIESDDDEVYYYDLLGRRLNGKQKGIYIVKKGSDVQKRLSLD